MSSLDLICTKNKHYTSPTQHGGDNNGQSSNDNLLLGLHDELLLDVLAWTTYQITQNLLCSERLNLLILS